MDWGLSPEGGADARRYGHRVDTYLAIVAKREVRSYSDRPIPPELVDRILEAGRTTGSAANRQPWRFLVLESPEVRDAVAKTVYEPANLRAALLSIAIVVRGGRTADFDAGRAAQNLMLAASNFGVGSCPNGVADVERFAEVVGLAEGERPVIVLSFGYPARPRAAEDRSPEEWLRSARRKPLAEVVRRL
jgi:nitroreductase